MRVLRTGTGKDSCCADEGGVGEPAHPDHRHRGGHARRWAGAGDARHAGHHARVSAPVLAAVPGAFRGD